jgi:AcrR family transcriptional regulator
MIQQDLHVQSNVKNEGLVEKRRQQILQAAIQLFREKGFHRATTREIATLAGFSIGTLYEYVRCKEDVLYLICDQIFMKVQELFEGVTETHLTIQHLENSIIEYIQLVDYMHNEFTIMYQETKSLPNEAKQYVMNKEFEMVSFFERLLHNCIDLQQLAITRDEVYLAANQIVVMGQSWAFRKWAFQHQYTVEEFIELQLRLFMNGLKRKNTSNSVSV